ncbi:hypothetical protein LDO26_12715 [Luteimonas sp. BDR2-5]|uniref:hypothetical protein n=1 Tax=Proluteimonas luteida TaxID=2878685 RepID=UPI001E6150CA|nr:hypothetical protein [Luteimonas sp. BDR2-5]MCD9029063.1 hypothetical protein [Luteimonas sp. BDR2-5]
MPMSSPTVARHLIAAAALGLLLSACGKQDDAQPTATAAAPATGNALPADDAPPATAAVDTADDEAPIAFTGDDMQRQMVEMAAGTGGGMQALAEACGHGNGSSGELKTLDASQRKAMTDLGIDPEYFRQRFNAFYRESKPKIAALSKAELDTQCRQLQQMIDEGERLQREAGRTS